MKYFIILATGLFCINAFAGTKSFDVKAQVSINGKLISSPHIITKPNELASISQKGDNNKQTLIELIASDYSTKDTKDGIMMKFTVSSIDNGKKTVISKPQIIALPGEPAEILVGETGKADSVRVSVVATRIQ